MKIELDDLVRINLGADEHLVLCMPDTIGPDDAEHIANALANSPLAGRTTVVVGTHAHKVHGRRGVRRFLRSVRARGGGLL